MKIEPRLERKFLQQSISILMIIIFQHSRHFSHRSGVFDCARLAQLLHMVSLDDDQRI